MDTVLEKQEAPTQEYFDAALLRCRSIAQIKSKKYVVVGKGENFYHQAYNNGRRMGRINFSDEPLPHFPGSEHVLVGDTRPGIDSDHMQDILTGKRSFDDSSLDQVARENLTLDQAISSQLIVFVTNDQQAGYKRLYFMHRGLPLLGAPHFAKVRSADIESGLWTFAHAQTGSPEYLLIDLSKKSRLF